MIDARTFANVFRAAANGIRNHWLKRMRQCGTYATADYEHAMTQAGAFDGVADLFEKLAEAETAAAVSPEAPHA